MEEIKISEAISLEAEKLKSKETESELLIGRILTAEISKLYVCVNCNGRIPAEDDSDPKMVKCTSFGQMMLVSFLSATLSANFLLGDVQGEKKGVTTHQVPLLKPCLLSCHLPRDTTLNRMSQN